MKKKDRLLPFQGSRLIFFRLVMIFTFMIMIARLYDYQFVQRDRFIEAANENAIQSVPLPAARGVIYDRFNAPLALNSPAWIVTVTPADLPDDEKGLAVLNRLSSYIGVPATRAAADAAGRFNIRSLEEMVKEGEGIAPYRPVIVRTDVDQAIVQQILEDAQNLPGVQVQWGAVRQYPTGPTTAQLVGYLGPIGPKEADELRKQGYNPSFERTGYAGIEASMNDQLAGLRGRRVQKVDVAGRVIEGGLISEVPAMPGLSIRLSLDVNLQTRAQSALTAEIAKINNDKQANWTQSGVVIAMNPQNGEILAMVSWPTYDNSKFARFIDAGYYTDLLTQEQYPLINHAVSSTYPPGSTWKVLTSVAVVQEGVIKPETFLNDPGSLIVVDQYAPNDVARQQRFVCWDRDGHKQVNLIKAIAVSCDVYFYQVGGGNGEVSPQSLRPGGLGINNLRRYASAFGIGEPTLIELVGAQSGLMPDPEWKRRTQGESWSTGDTYNAAFGQGYVIVTPLQLVNMAATIANGGNLYHPTIINNFLDGEGNAVDPMTGEPLPSAGNKGNIMRTLVLPENNSKENPAILMLSEDMKVRGKNSISCICEDGAFNLNDPSTPQAVRDLYGRQIQDPKKPDDPTAKIWVCDPLKVNANYRPTIKVDRDTTPIENVTNRIQRKTVRWQDITYKVFIPFDYIFSDGVCDENVFDRTVSKLKPEEYKLSVLQTDLLTSANPGDSTRDYTDIGGLIGYQPPFVDPNVFALVQKGMRAATKSVGGADFPGGDNPAYNIRKGEFAGTAGPRSVRGDTVGYNLSTYSFGTVETAGKTGTAEYCDDLASAQNLCKQGSWPAHAWFLGYAPAEKPEIMIVAFVYHGNEGAAAAMPVARIVTDCYFRLKDARAQGKTQEQLANVCPPGQDVAKP